MGLSNLLSKAQQGATTATLRTIKGMNDLSRRQRYKLAKQTLSQGLKKTLARTAMVTSVANSSAEAKKEAAKANAASYQRALEIYQSLINQNAQPAEGTGDPSAGTGGNSTTGNSGTGPNPTGNK